MLLRVFLFIGTMITTWGSDGDSEEKVKKLKKGDIEKSVETARTQKNLIIGTTKWRQMLNKRENK
jgi:hypothetical protein